MQLLQKEYADCLVSTVSFFIISHYLYWHYLLFGKVKSHFFLFTETNEVEHLCTVCNKTFNNRSNLRRHAKRLHPDKISDIVPFRYKNSAHFKFTCNLCQRNYNIERCYKYHLKMHGREANPNGESDEMRNSKKCPLCDFVHQKRDKILSHFESDHLVPMGVANMEFPSFDEVLKWKEKMENDTNTRFFKEFENERDGHAVIGYKCHRSGNYKTRGLGIRRLKMQGTNKINAFCPASIRVIIDTPCRVKFQSTHIGHINDIGHLTLSNQEKSVLIKKLCSDMPIHSIIEEIKKSVPENDELKRIHVVSRKDLHNLKQRINVKDEPTETDEKVATEIIQDPVTGCGNEKPLELEPINQNGEMFAGKC